MAQPTNTFDTYDSKALKEDISSVIYNIDPSEVPLLSSIAKTSASNTLHQWQTDSLRSATAGNKNIEGDATTAEQRTSVARIHNFTQIFKNAVTISGTDQAVTNVGYGKQMAHEILKVAKEQKTDMESSLFANLPFVAGNATTARQLGGLTAYIKTNVTNIGANGANPTGSIPGATARAPGGLSVFNQAKFDTNMQQIWTSGGTPDTVYLSSANMQRALGFTGNNNERATAQNGKVTQLLSIYMTPWGSVTFTPSRFSASRDVFILQTNMLALASLRPMKNEPLSKQGDNITRQVLCEATLVVRNEKSLGLIADCTA
tara:strand:+ start:287 stop:1237 length:951 start_codon:yes stop_codon:yes gene_type:complete